MAFGIDMSSDAGTLASTIRAANVDLAGRYHPSSYSRWPPSGTMWVYGSGAVCARLSGAGLASCTWLARSIGWRGSQDYQEWNLKQSAGVTGLGFAHESNASQEDYVGFSIEC